MPATYSRRQDPYHNINNWDDGYEYIPPGSDPGRGRNADPYYSPPPAASQSQRSARRDGCGPDLPRPPVGDSLEKSRYPSPPSTAEDRSRPRRRRSPSPAGPKRRAPPGAYPVYTPPSSQGRPSPPDPYRNAAPRTRSPGRGRSPPPRGRSLPSESRNPRDPPQYRAYSRSPPPRARRPRAAGYDEQPARSDRDRDGPRRMPPRYNRSPSPSVIPQAKATDKIKMNRKRFSELSSRWGPTAAAALQAGTMAALQMRGDGGAWKGEKGARVASAAFGAVAKDAFNKRGEKGGDRGQGRYDDREWPRDRDRERARSIDRYRDRSRDRSRDRRRDRDRDRGRGSYRGSYSDRGKSPRRSKSKRQSGLEELGGALGGMVLEQIVNSRKKR